MQKLIKAIFALLSSIILLAIVLIIGLITFINPNDFKPQLVKKVYETTGRKLILNGDFHWLFFPTLGLHIEEAQLSNTTDANIFAQAKQTTIQVQPLPLLKKQLVVGTLKINALALNLSNAKKLQATDVTLHFDVKNKIISLNQIHASLYQGTYSGNIVLDTNGVTPKITIDSSFTNIQVEPLMQALVNVTHVQLAGVANLNAYLTLQSNLKTLNGNGSFALNNGILKGVDVRYWLQTAQALVHKKTLSQTNTKQTSFDHLTGSFAIHNGVVENNDLVLQAPDARANGRGTADLVNQQLNYQLTLQRVKNGELKDIPIPLILSGNFSNLNIRLNVESLLSQQVKDQLKIKIGEQLQKSLGKNLGDQLSKQLNNLLH